MKKFIGVFTLAIVFILNFVIEKAEEKHINDIIAQEKKDPHLDFTLTDYTDKVNIHHKNQIFHTHLNYKNVEPWLSALGAYTAVADFNNDGWQDIYLGTTRKGTLNHLYQNMKDGTFQEVAKNVGLADINKQYPTTGALFFDCDNDDDKDFIAFSGHPQVFINEDNTYHLLKESGINEHFATLIAAYNTFDYDRDGDLDIVFGEYFKQDLQADNKDHSGLMPKNFTNSQNYSKFRLYKNDGNCHFTKVEKPDFYTDGWHLDIGVFDYFDNNKFTVWFASDYGEDFIFTETEKGHYKRIRKFSEYPELSKNGMSVAFSYLSEDNIPSAYVSNVFQLKEKLSGNLLWQKTQGSDTLKENSRNKNVLDCGWSWTNMFSDINNDGLEDLLVNNGFISADTKKDYWYSLSVLDSANAKHLSNYKNWPTIGNASLAGYERDCLYINRGDHFEDVSYLTDFDKLKQDGRGMAVIDYMNNGSLAIVTANRNGISKFYRVEQKNHNNWIGLDLKGTKSNHDALSVKAIFLLSDGSVKKFFHHPTNHFSSQSDSRLHIGLGDKKIDKVKLVWPSGIVQVIPAKNLQLNQYNKVVEQETL